MMDQSKKFQAHNPALTAAYDKAVGKPKPTAKPVPSKPSPAKTLPAKPSTKTRPAKGMPY
jgi:hypothetical protein